jgi:hypothetical protein
VVQQLARFGDEDVAGTCQRHGALVAVREADVEFLFESADLLAHRRLADVASLGSATEMQLLGQRHEALQAHAIHAFESIVITKPNQYISRKSWTQSPGQS